MYRDLEIERRRPCHANSNSTSSVDRHSLSFSPMSAAVPSLGAPPRQSRQLLLDDCRELHRKQFLTAAQLAAFEEQVAALPPLTIDPASSHSGTSSYSSNPRQDPQLALLLAQVRALYQHELETIVTGIREQHNQKQHDTYVTSDLLALAAGGAMGALNAWLQPAAAKPSPPPRPATKAPSLWASAFDAAQASLNVVRKRRLLEHLQLKHLSGDESVCDHVLLCINGFMTQGADPTRNWGAWCSDNVAVYAVLWEAGDADAWNDFCAHANDHLAAPSVGAATSALFTHFTGNPWHKAQTQAEQVGALLAQVLAAQPTFCRGRQVTLLGHSLGGAVIYSFFQEVARLRRASSQALDDDNDETTNSRFLPLVPLPSTPLVTNAVSFAGAFLPTADGLANVSAELPLVGKFLNVFSSRDSVLSKLFWALQLHASDPVAAGCSALRFPSACAHNCANVDVTALVPVRLTNQFGHGYAMHMDEILLKLRPYLPSVYGSDAAH